MIDIPEMLVPIEEAETQLHSLISEETTSEIVEDFTNQFFFDDYLWTAEFEEAVLMHIFKDDEKMFQVHSYIQQEVNDRVSGIPMNPGNAYKVYPALIKDRIKGEAFAFTYSERMSPQIDDIIRHLKFIENSKSAVMTIHSNICPTPHNMGGGAHVVNPSSDLENLTEDAHTPAVMNYQFILRDGKMHMIVNVRSVDFYKDFIIELLIAMRLHIWIAHKTETPNIGWLSFKVGILHAEVETLKNRVG